MPETDHCGAYFADRVVYTQKVRDFFELYLKKPRLQLVVNNVEEDEEELSEAS